MGEGGCVSELVRRKGLCEGLELARRNVIYEVLKFRESLYRSPRPYGETAK